MNSITIRPTQVVRNVMKSHGKTYLFTNKYKTCRSVKCYGSASNSPAMVKEIKRVLSAIGVKHEVHTNWSNGYRGCTASIIVTLPL